MNYYIRLSKIRPLHLFLNSLFGDFLTSSDARVALNSVGQLNRFSTKVDSIRISYSSLVDHSSESFEVSELSSSRSQSDSLGGGGGSPFTV